LDRLHLESLGSFAFYRQAAKKLGWKEVAVRDMTDQLVRHYTRVREELRARRSELVGKVSAEYMDRMILGLTHWIAAGERGHLAWGILHFQKAGENHRA
jgi:sarcosine/dimethylglycine N-methyltransferase